MKPQLKLYSTDWCPKSAQLRNYLQSVWVDFEDLNVETNPDADLAVRALYDGALKFPTVQYGGQHLKNPSVPRLETFLKNEGLL